MRGCIDLAAHLRGLAEAQAQTQAAMPIEEVSTSDERDASMKYAPGSNSARRNLVKSLFAY